MTETFFLYNATIELQTTFNNDKHEYKVRKAGTDDKFKVVPGPTTALGVLDKPLLRPWAVKETVKELGYYEKQLWTPDGYVPIPEAEQSVGFERMKSIHDRIKTMTPQEYWQSLHVAKGASNRKKEGAADSGTMVHLWVEQYINGENPAMPTLEAVRNGVEAWLRWVESADVKFTLSEEKIYSKKYKYAGTLDFACTINGVPTMGDLKTSNFFNPEMFWQVSAYQYARQEEFPNEQYDQQVIVRCGKDGKLEVILSTGYQKDIKAFLACWTIWKRKNELKKIYGNS